MGINNAVLLVLGEWCRRTWLESVLDIEADYLRRVCEGYVMLQYVTNRESIHRASVPLVCCPEITVDSLLSECCAGDADIVVVFRPQSY